MHVGVRKLCQSSKQYGKERSHNYLNYCKGCNRSPRTPQTTVRVLSDISTTKPSCIKSSPFLKQQTKGLKMRLGVLMFIVRFHNLNGANCVDHCVGCFISRFFVRMGDVRMLIVQFFYCWMAVPHITTRITNHSMTRTNWKAGPRCQSWPTVWGNAVSCIGRPKLYQWFSTPDVDTNHYKDLKAWFVFALS